MRAEGGGGAGQQLVVGLPPVGRALDAVLEVAGPALLDLRAGEARPLAGVALAEVRVEDDGADAELAGEDRGGLGRPVQVGGDDGVDRAECPGRVVGLGPPEVGQGRVGLALPAAVGVPLRLAVAHEEDPGHGVDGSGGPFDLGTGRRYARSVVVLRLFAAAREAAGTGRDEVPGATVGEVLRTAASATAAAFADVLATAQVWRNGEPCADGDAVGDGDEVAVLPPVSGGCG